MNLFFQFNQQKKISKSVFGVLIGVIFYISQASFPFTHEMGLKQEHQPPINAVIGNSALRQSGVDLESLSEQAKIQTHLAFVETHLRSHTPTSISRSDYPRRQALLHYLAQYRKAGIFPSQNKYPGRRPHFIDQQGRICAVGYLIQKTAGLTLAQAINKKFEYAYLQDMQDDRLAAWVARSGFTLRELSMIQPSYGWQEGG